MAEPEEHRTAAPPDWRSCCIVVPCHNEAGCIAGVVADLARHCPGAAIAAVNDASTDRTEAVLRQLAHPRLTVLSLPTNLGIGGAVQTGLRYAAANGFDYAAKFDGDGQHRAAELPALLAPLLAGEADLAIGSRFLGRGRKGFQSTFLRRLGIRVFRALSFVLTGRLVTDNTSGFRAYNRRALGFAAEYYPSFDYPEPEEVILFLRNGFRVTEIPVEMIARQAGKSSINFLKSIYYMLKVIFAVLMAAVRPKVERTE